MNDIKFYNICPAGIESGGPELAHQMCNTLVRLGYNARMYYNQSNKSEPCDVSASARYLKYNTEHAKSMAEVEDESSVVMRQQLTGYQLLIIVIKYYGG